MCLELTTRQNTSKRLYLGAFSLNPVPCSLPPEKGFTRLERKFCHSWWCEKGVLFGRCLKPHSNFQTGFTLLELLCSMVILSFLLAAIYGAFNMGSRAWEKGERDIDKIQRMRVIMDFLGREIKSTFPYQVTPSELDTHKKFYAFEGKKDSISFVSTVPLRGGKKGLSWLSFWVEDNKGLVVVERDALRTDIFKERNFIDKDEMEVLDEHVSSMRFEYYELKRGREEGEGEWRERWDAEKKGTLPHAVRIELTFREEGRGEEDIEEIQRELIIPIMIYGKKIRVWS